MIYNREKYVRILADKQWNGRIKVITGLRRCGKSTVLFDLFKAHLIENGVRPDHILEIALDIDENEKYRDPYEMSGFIREKCNRTDDKYYFWMKYSTRFLKRNCEIVMNQSGCIASLTGFCT